MKEWADEGQKMRTPLSKAIAILEKCENMGMNLKECRVLVQGSGMGRILQEIFHRFHPMHLEGSEKRPLYYIFSEYFLSAKKEPAVIFPYVHEFTNNSRTDKPYEPVKIERHPDIEEERVANSFGPFC